MPICTKFSFTPFVLMIFASLYLLFTNDILADEGIQKFYIRYENKSSNNKIVDTNLIMVPSKNDFRAEKFSQISTKGVISAGPGELNASVEKRIKESFLKTILIKNGLKSIKTKDYDTIISYEGVIITPLNILKKTYNQEQKNYFYEAQVKFSPIAFPDQWNKLNMKYKVKKIFHDFFQLFQ